MVIQTMNTEKTRFRRQYSALLSTFLVFVLAVAIVFCGWKPAVAASSCVAANGDKEHLGCWEKVPLPRKKGAIWSLQSVHTSLLPDGKILMVNGSSNRNTINRGASPEFIDGVKTTDQDVVSNTAIFDPKKGTFTPIETPPAVQSESSNDLFCSGHLHLSNGDILFVGGSNRYYPGEQFDGSRQTNIYHWQKSDHSWSTVGQMDAGRWYPTLIEMADGKVVIFSGQDYELLGQITKTIDIYDPDTKRLHNIDLSYVKDSPFNVRVKTYTYLDKNGESHTKQAKTRNGNTRVYDSIDLYPRVFPTADGRILITGDGAGKFPLEVHQSNKTYLMSVHQDGDNYSVSFELGPDRKDVAKVYGTAVADPNREGDVLLLGGILNTNNINFGKPQLGAIDKLGHAPVGSTNEGLIKAGARIASSMEHWDSQNNEWSIDNTFLKTDDGRPQPRAMNEAVILPNKEILTVNGGLYAEYAQVYEPLLMTYDDADKSYTTQEMNPATLPRLYHNGALLLPDARVLTIGGNANRAAREQGGLVHVDVVPAPSKGEAQISKDQAYYELAKLRKGTGTPKVIPEDEYAAFLEDYYKSPESYFAYDDEEGVPFAPAEIWQVEIFNPPYLFGPGDRPEINISGISGDDIPVYHYGESETITVSNAEDQQGGLVLVKLGSITHSFDADQRLADLDIEDYDLDDGIAYVNFSLPENAHLYPPGHYMMFYVNGEGKGKPSMAKIIQLAA